MKIWGLLERDIISIQMNIESKFDLCFMRV